MLKTGTRSWSKSGGKHGLLDEPQPPVDAHRRAAHVPLLPRDLTGERSRREDVRSDDDRVDARAEVVDVRDRDHAYASIAKRVEDARRAQGSEEVSVPRRIQRHAPVVVQEELARRVERSETN